MKKLSTAQRLMAHLDKNGKDYYASIIAKTEQTIEKDNLRQSELRTNTNTYEKALAQA